MRGDIITHFNGEVVADHRGYGALIQRYAGQGIVLRTLREGQERKVELRLRVPEVGAAD